MTTPTPADELWSLIAGSSLPSEQMVIDWRKAFDKADLDVDGAMILMQRMLSAAPNPPKMAFRTVLRLLDEFAAGHPTFPEWVRDTWWPAMADAMAVSPSSWTTAMAHGAALVCNRLDSIFSQPGSYWAKLFVSCGVPKVASLMRTDQAITRNRLIAWTAAGMPGMEDQGSVFRDLVAMAIADPWS